MIEQTFEQGVTQRGLRRREALIAGAGGGAALVAGLPPIAEGARPRRRRRRKRTLDTLVVGAGLAGLTAARRIRAAGRSVRVLEARDRVGGRTLDHRFKDGTVVELGGEWAGPGQDHVLGLAKDLGIETFESTVPGDSLYVNDGKVTRYSGDVPPVNPTALVEFALAIENLNQMAGTVSPSAPWSAASAREWDSQTVATFFRDNLRTDEAREVAALAIRAVYGEEPAEISLLNLLAGITSVGGDFETLIGSAQTIRFEGGPQRLATGLARSLPRTIELASPVLAIRRSAQRVTVYTQHESWRARQVILALPLHLIGRLRFEPALPPALDQFLQRVPMGSVIKANVVYPEPFWRADGLNGEVVSLEGPVEVVADNSPPGGRPGVLVAFLEADKGRPFLAVSPAQRRELVLDALVRCFGPRAGQPRDYIDTVWAAERWTGGAYGAITGPGVLTGLGALSSGPVPRLHLAGADTASAWAGYMDGAISSGEKAADAALAAMG